MMTRFRTYCRWVLPTLLFAGPVAAQQALPIIPLTSDPARAAYVPTMAQQAQQRGTALSLPFFDDFTSPLEGAPSILRWQAKGGALVSNRFALAPLTRGAATLDGLTAKGLTYSGGAVTSPNATLDSLISQPINLAGLTPASNVVLSFAWQAGSVVGLPNNNSLQTPVRLELFVKTNTSGTIGWESKWSVVSRGRTTPFRQQTIALDQTKYLHGDFQFMLVATGNTTVNSDTWSVDYVLLNQGRTLTDTVFVDAATGAGLVGGNPSGGLRSPLRRFSSMPVWQYNAATTSELNPAMGVNVTNLDTGPPLSVTTTGKVRELPSGAPIGTWLQDVNTIPTNTRQSARTGDASAAPLPTTATAKRFRYSMYIASREPATSPTIANDTISRDLELSNYYAYDDGTAESATQLFPYTTGQQSALAYRFDLNQPDYVRGLRLYPVFTSDLAARPITVSIWDDNAGVPALNARATKTYTIQYPYPTGWDYYQVDFDQPVRVTGSFYVGFSQPSTGRYLQYATDLNSTYPAQHFFRRDNTGAWTELIPTTTSAVVLMRPVMTNSNPTATASAQEAAAYSLYPNPAHNAVTISGPAFARAAVLDALGRNVWEQPTAQAGKFELALPTLPAGVYTVRLTLHDGHTVSRRLLLE
ncbi:T9SS type A sorting domain-containing protein [Hymenobacter negativus]|uniref:T9SS type A sorting domain-containing protein n=1 Tax=Hymenobacter negativus TaxID=2795026 RepID=A0ABS3QIG7_9BACT|nr:T9SS type A sorting domain-containing protein [Hymenobacter negativus]MBO2010818.1 T9SS type A sorting domain-containing protein [Hymenobacter negativus]